MSFRVRLKMSRAIVQDELHRSASRGIFFVEVIEDAERLAASLNDLPIASYHSQMKRAIQRHRLAHFEHGELRTLLACKSLDEGINGPVNGPEADYALLLAPDRSRRRFIQRMGRVLRRREDGRPATIWVLLVDGVDYEVPLTEQECSEIYTLCEVQTLDYRSSGPGRTVT